MENSLCFSDQFTIYANPFRFYRINLGSNSPYDSCHGGCIWNYDKKHIQSNDKHGIFGSSLLGIAAFYVPQFYNYPEIKILELESGRSELINTDNNLSCEIEVLSCNILRVLDIKVFCLLALEATQSGEKDMLKVSKHYTQVVVHTVLNRLQ